MNKKLLISIFIILVIIIIPIILLYVLSDNKTIDYTNYQIDEVSNNKIKIMQLSDMHFPKCEIDLNDVITKIKDEEIDIIAITGDLIDGNNDLAKSGVKDFIELLNTLPNVFYVSGNHEINSNKFNELKKLLIKNNITILENESKEIIIRKNKLTIMGLIDNTKYSSKLFNSIDKDSYKILLAHRPELFDSYIDESNELLPNITLTGHAHGGQIRIHNKGLIAPNQGFNPKYTSGIFKNAEGTKSMIISRGVGNSILPYRIFNHPEIPIIKIYL